MITVFLATGFEEIEALTPVDLLRRAGVEVKTVGVGSKTVVGSHGIPVTADLTEAELMINNLDGVILPGGMPGTKNLEASETVQKAIAYCAAHGKLLAAICAAPSVLGHAGLLRDKRATCFPGFEKDLLGATFVKEDAVRDENVITSRGAGTALAFAEKLIAYAANEEKAANILSSVLAK